MVTNDLNIFCTLLLPTKANAPLIVDTNAALAGTVAFEHFKAISGRHSQVIQVAGNLELSQFPSCHRCNIYKPPHADTL